MKIAALALGALALAAPSAQAETRLNGAGACHTYLSFGCNRTS